MEEELVIPDHIVKSKTEDVQLEKYVIKGDGTQEKLDLNKLRMRFQNRSMGLNMDYINFDVIVAKLAGGIYQGTLIFFTCAYRCEHK